MKEGSSKEWYLKMNTHKLSSAFIRDLQKRTALDLSFQSEGRWDNNQKIKIHY